MQSIISNQKCRSPDRLFSCSPALFISAFCGEKRRRRDSYPRDASAPNCFQDRLYQKVTNENKKTCESEAKNSAECLALFISQSPVLTLLVERWEQLPEVVRVAIMAMVKVASPSYATETLCFGRKIGQIRPQDAIYRDSTSPNGINTTGKYPIMTKYSHGIDALAYINMKLSANHGNASKVE